MAKNKRKNEKNINVRSVSSSSDSTIDREILERGYDSAEEFFLHEEQTGKLSGVETLSSSRKNGENLFYGSSSLEGTVVRRLHSDGPRFDSEAIQSENNFQKMNKNNLYTDENINGDGNSSFSNKNGSNGFTNGNSNILNNQNDINHDNSGNDNNKKYYNKCNENDDNDGNINGVDGQMDSDHRTEFHKVHSLTFGSSSRAIPKNQNMYVHVFIRRNRMYLRIL